MVRKNEMGEFAFLIKHAFALCLFWLIFMAYFFRPIPFYSTAYSKTHLLILIEFLTPLGFFLSYFNYRNNTSVLVNALTPFLLYLIDSQFYMIEGYMRPCIPVVIVLAVLYHIVVIVNYKHIPPKWRIFRCFFRSVMVLRIIAVICIVAFVVVPITYGIMADKPKYSVVLPIEGCFDEKAELVCENINTLLKLREDTWIALSPEERLDVLQHIANLEVLALGLPHELMVTTERLGASLLACYRDASHEIIVNSKYLESENAHVMLVALCHEARHAMQHRFCDALLELKPEYQKLLPFADAHDFLENFIDYKDECDGTYEEYYEQACEKDARTYSEQVAANYISLINQYLTEKRISS